MSSDIMEVFISEIISKLKKENLLIIDSDVAGITDLLLNDNELDIRKNYEINENIDW